MQKALSSIWQAQLGLAVATTGNAKLQGVIWDDADSEFDNHSYRYKIRSNRLAVKGKLLLDKGYWLKPWVSASAGVGFNRNHYFTNTPLIFEALPNPNFTNNTKTTFTYTDVVIATPAGGATLTNGYTYVATAVGQAASGGTIACLNGGLNNLIAATTDNSPGIEWGGFGIVVGIEAQSNTDGASNTTAIVDCLTNGAGGGAGGINISTYAAGICSTFEVDSQGNTPCQAGNTCYNDWFLPAGNNLTATGQLNCLFINRAAIGGFANGDYWSSTESSDNSTQTAWFQGFIVGGQIGGSKNFNLRVRCVRAFTP